MDLLVEFTKMYNEPADIQLYTYQIAFIRSIFLALIDHKTSQITGLWSRQCLARGTLVRMWDGTLKAAEDVVVGDQLTGDDGRPRSVLSVHTGREQMVRVGGRYTVNRSHVLSLLDREGQRVDIPVDEFMRGRRFARVYDDSFKGYRVDPATGHLWDTHQLWLEDLPEDDFYGFTVDGNHRFLLGDCTVTHNSGKSESIASCASTLTILLPVLANRFPGDPRLTSFKRGIWIGIYAPRMQQAQIIYDRIRDRMERDSSKAILSDPDIHLTMTASRGDHVGLSNGSFVVAQTASEQSNAEGRTFHLIIIDEAQIVSKSKVNKELRPMLASCVTSDTLIAMQTGELLRMDDVQRLQRRDVWAISENAEIVPATVSQFIDSGTQPTMRMTLKSGRNVEGTREHPVLVRTRLKPRQLEWRKLRDLKLGDHVCLPRALPCFGNYSVGGVDEAYLMGALIGDGTYRNDGCVRLANADESVWESAEKVSARHELRIRFHKETPTQDGRVLREGTITSLGGGAGANWIVNQLRDAGMWGQTGKSKRLQRLALLGKSQLAAALAGLYDTDGCITLQQGRAATVALTSISKELLEDVQHALQRFGIHGTLRFSPSKERVLRGRTLEASSAWRLIVSGKENVEQFVTEIPLRIPYRRAALAAAKAVYATRSSKRSSDYEDVIWEKVTKLEDTGLQQVWDVVVPEHHSFVGNGMFLHNTNGLMVQIGTANALQGNFRATIEDNLRKEARDNLRRHFEFPYDQVLAAMAEMYLHTKDPKHQNYKAYIDGELDRLGGNINNVEFAQNFRLLWQETQAGAIDIDAWEAAGDPNRGWIHTKHNARIVAGLDFARKRDMSVLSFLLVDMDKPVVDLRSVRQDANAEPKLYYPKHLLAVYAIPGRKWHDILADVASYCRNFSVDTLVGDGTGVGDPVLEQLANLIPEVHVVPFVFSTVGNDRLFKSYIQEIEAGRFTYPDDEDTKQDPTYADFMHQHEILVRDNSGIYTKFYAPEDEHDDFPDSVALANYAAELPEHVGGTGGVAVSSQENPFYQRQPLGSEAVAAGGRARRYR